MARSLARNTGEEDEDGEETEGTAPKKGKRSREAAAAVTLEPNFDSLNAKSLDAAFTVDPLFHKTSAMFDEGGAKGLLLNNLSVYRGCHVGFDSQLVPEHCLTEAPADSTRISPLPSLYSVGVGNANGEEANEGNGARANQRPEDDSPLRPGLVRGRDIRGHA